MEVNQISEQALLNMVRWGWIHDGHETVSKDLVENHYAIRKTHLGIRILIPTETARNYVKLKEVNRLDLWQSIRNRKQ